MSSIRQVAKEWRFYVLVAGVIAISVVLAPQAQADDVTVTCPPPDVPVPDDYPSIQAAVNAVTATSLTGPHTITVKGDCVGRIFIGDGGNLGPRGIAIVAAPEGASIHPASATGVVVQICGAQDIYLERLVIRGGAVGLLVCDLSEVDTLGLTIENNTSRGADVYGNSMLFFADQTVIRNNGGTGVLVRGGSRMFFLDLGALPGATEVYGHSLWGVNAENGTVIEVRGAHQFRHNGTAGNAESGGIRASRTSELLVVSNSQGNPSISNNNGPGVLLETGSSASFQGATLSNNAGVGAQVQRLSVAELLGSNTFSANGGSAISCDNSSWVAGDLTGIKPLSCSNVAKPPK